MTEHQPIAAPTTRYIGLSDPSTTHHIYNRMNKATDFYVKQMVLEPDHVLWDSGDHTLIWKFNTDFVQKTKITNLVNLSILHDPIDDFTKNIYINVSGVKDGLHGIHIHKAGDLRDGCTSACDHYNPTNTTHGDLYSGHSGDLGNIKVVNNICIASFYCDKFIVDEIIGRSLIIHENKDDLGLTNHKDSKITGNSGKRLCCSIIGISKNSC